MAKKNIKKSAGKSSGKKGISNAEKRLILTPNEERFVFLLIEGYARRRAYREAYPNCKAADNVVDVKAYQLFNRDKVRIRYNELRRELARQRLDEAVINGKRADTELEKLAYDDYYRPEKGERAEAIPLAVRLNALKELRRDYGEIIKAQAEADSNEDINKIEVNIRVVNGS